MQFSFTAGAAAGQVTGTHRAWSLAGSQRIINEKPCQRGQSCSKRANAQIIRHQQGGRKPYWAPAKASWSPSMSHEIHQQLTDRTLKALAEGLVPWGKPWLGHRNDGPPTNALTSLPFRGVNPLLLNLAGFQSKWWATEWYWKVFGYRLKSHQQGTQVFT